MHNKITFAICGKMTYH